MHVGKCVFAVAAVCGSLVAQASDSGQSYTGYINVGGDVYVGKPSIGVNGFQGGLRENFSAIQGMVPLDANGVTTLTQAMMPPMFSPLGNFNFKQVSSQEVYLGEWSQNGTLNDPTRTVYYSGFAEGRVLPTTDVTYLVQGINNYTGANLMSGDLTATFGAASPKLTGYMGSSALRVAVSAGIDKSTASFSGYAYALHPTANTVLSAGTTKGSFFGAGATASLAGIAKFANRNYDTAFGGVKK